VVPLSDGDIHLWCAFLDQPATRLQRLAAVLSADERLRAGRLRFERDRRRFIACRALLRVVLGGYAGVPPSGLRFRYGSHGKPALVATGGEPAVRFSVAHSHELALYAITRRREVGVDLEHIRPIPEAGAIAQRCFPPRECAALRGGPAEGAHEAFLRGWTRREARLKADGAGLGGDADPREAPRWFTQELRPAPGYVGALVVEGHQEVGTMHRIEQDDTTTYKVVVNLEEQYSIWPAGRENPAGWRDAGKSGSKTECLAYIKTVWTDMRPLGLRERMDGIHRRDIGA
jgi:4'-phosphopantetheinyl transferase